VTDVWWLLFLVGTDFNGRPPVPRSKALAHTDVAAAVSKGARGRRCGCVVTAVTATGAAGPSCKIRLDVFQKSLSFHPTLYRAG